MDPEETWERANFFFPHFLNDISLPMIIGKWCKRKYKPIDNVNAAIQIELQERLKGKIIDLSDSTNDEMNKARWKDMTKNEIDEEFCIAVGMNEEVVHLRFKLMENIEKDLDFLIDKSHILHSIQHIIDTIHINDAFGKETQINGVIRDDYRGKSWISYLGVQWQKSQLGVTVTEVEQKIDD